MPRPVLIVMVKQPRPGRVKTRLARDIGAVAATWWYRHQTRRLLRRLRDPRWRIVLAVAPDRAEAVDWPRDLARMPQGGGDLGARMLRALGRVPGPVCLIGSDIPGVTPAHIAQAFDGLRRAPVVFGPAPDGGFWLVGLRQGSRPPRGLFQAVRWSTEHALADSLKPLGPTVAFADTLADVDRAEDLSAHHP